MSARASAWAWRQIRLGRVANAAARLVLLKLADRADDQGVCWPGAARTAGDCALSEKGVRKAIGELEEGGLIKVERRSEDGRSLSNRFFLALDAEEGEGERSSPRREQGSAGGGNGVPGGREPRSPEPPKEPVPKNTTTGGGYFDSKFTPNPSTDSTGIFLEAAGNPAILVAEAQKLAKAIAGATVEQAKLAGLAWLETKDKKSSIGLAVKLCRLAAKGEVTPCKAAVAENAVVEKQAAEQGYKRLRALHGKKYRTQDGRIARVDRDCVCFDPCHSYPKGSCNSFVAALADLAQIEQGQWQPIA